jgi:HEPN domain-containing protein
MTRNKIIDFWIESSEEDFKVASGLFKLKHYPQSLFFCHLSLEKLLKGLIVKHTKENPPFSHDLEKLAILTSLEMSKENVNILNEISSFNIAGRYGDEKFEFYKKFNKKDVALKYLNLTKELTLWLKKESQKK